MQLIRAVGLGLLCVAGLAAAADTSFTGAFNGTGRACNGSLFVRERTIEWISTYSICKPSRYEVLEKDLAGDHQRIAFRVKTRSRQCRYEVFELQQVSRYGWAADGYPSLEAFKKRDLPDWRNSPMPERFVLECPMVRLN
jgi:hypothetical protein